VNNAGTVSGYGTLAADLNSEGTFTGRGFASGTPGTLSVSGSAFFDSASILKLRGGVSSDLLAVGGDLTLAGTVQIALAPGTAFGRHLLMTYGGILELGTLAVTGTSGHLSTSVAGRVDLVIDDSDEDGLPDSWENTHLGNLAQGPNDDKDGDGQDNAVEYLAGTLPNNGASRFAATLAPWSATQFTLAWPSVPGRSYGIETNASLAGSWSLLTTIPAAAAPATHTRHTLTKSSSVMFYRISLKP